MSVSLGTELEAYRSNVLGFLKERLPADWRGMGSLKPHERSEFQHRWRRELLEHGYLGVTWPKKYGGAGHGPAEEFILQEECARVGAPTYPLPSDIFAFKLIGPTLLLRGTEDQKSHFLPRALSGEYRFAQGFSEPEAGSDLFALRTRAELDAGGWVINGQKTWQTDGLAANWIFILARTEPQAPKAKGISMLLVPIDQPGVVVRPIRTMTGEEEFCEVFFDDARTAQANLVGTRGEGASIAMTLLGFERGAPTGSLHIEFEIEVMRLAQLAREHGRENDAVIRQRLAWCYSKVEILRYLTMRVLAAAIAGDPPGPESSIIKLYESQYHSRATELAMDILGPSAMARSGDPAVASLGPDPYGSPNSANAWQNVYMTARAATIYGGSSQIQRTTLGERVLGLPKEPRPNVGKA